MTPEEVALLRKMEIKKTNNKMYCVEARLGHTLDRHHIATIIGIAVAHADCTTYFWKKATPDSELTTVVEVENGSPKNLGDVANMEPIPEGQHVIIKTSDVYLAGVYSKQLEGFL